MTVTVRLRVGTPPLYRFGHVRRIDSDGHWLYIVDEARRQWQMPLRDVASLECDDDPEAAAVH